MNQRPSIADRISDLLGFAVEFGKLAMAQQLERVEPGDPQREALAALLRREIGPSYRLVPTFDAEYVEERLAYISTQREESVVALGVAIDRCTSWVRTIEAVARGQREDVALDCVTIASEQRVMHEQILLFYVRAAQILCAMEEIRGAVRFLHECDPDPTIPTPSPITPGLGSLLFEQPRAQGAPEAGRRTTAREAFATRYGGARGAERPYQARQRVAEPPEESELGEAREEAREPEPEAPTEAAGEDREHRARGRARGKGRPTRGA